MQGGAIGWLRNAVFSQAPAPEGRADDGGTFCLNARQSESFQNPPLLCFVRGAFD
jgi:hypothetical protein